jgi:hypothetical protein
MYCGVKKTCVNFGCTRDGDDVLALRENPRNGYRASLRAVFRADLLHLLRDRVNLREVLLRVFRDRKPEIALFEVLWTSLSRSEYQQHPRDTVFTTYVFATEKTTAERRVCDNGDTKLTARLE